MGLKSFRLKFQVVRGQPHQILESEPPAAPHVWLS